MQQNFIAPVPKKIIHVLEFEANKLYSIQDVFPSTLNKFKVEYESCNTEDGPILSQIGYFDNEEALIKFMENILENAISSQNFEYEFYDPNCLSINTFDKWGHESTSFINLSNLSNMLVHNLRIIIETLLKFKNDLSQAGEAKEIPVDCLYCNLHFPNTLHLIQHIRFSHT